jgi:hypothetical protein
MFPIFVGYPEAPAWRERFSVLEAMLREVVRKMERDQR